MHFYFYFYFILFYLYFFSFNRQQFVTSFSLNMNSVCLFSYISIFFDLGNYLLVWLWYMGSILASKVDLQIFAITVGFFCPPITLYIYIFVLNFSVTLLLPIFFILSICFRTLHFVYYEQFILLTVIIISIY